jgi:hypothetical protein
LTALGFYPNGRRASNTPRKTYKSKKSRILKTAGSAIRRERQSPDWRYLNMKSPPNKPPFRRMAFPGHAGCRILSGFERVRILSFSFFNNSWLISKLSSLP